VLLGVQPFSTAQAENAQAEHTIPGGLTPQFSYWVWRCIDDLHLDLQAGHIAPFKEIACALVGCGSNALVQLQRLRVIQTLLQGCASVQI
jgi:hypothetical protein